MHAGQGSTSRMRDSPVFLCCPPPRPQVLCADDGSGKASEDGVFGMWKVDLLREGRQGMKRQMGRI